MSTGDFASLLNGGFNPLRVTWFVIVHGGWLFFVFLLLAGFAVAFVRNRQAKYSKKIQWTMLAIDIPKNNEQTPKAVENIFSHLLTVKKSGDFLEKYWDGYTQQPLSFEIVSLGGYTQFLVRAPKKYRDLVEAAFYAQYPDAEITEVEDYTEDVPSKFPDKEWDMWGTELKLENSDYYPIVTYPLFEHQLTQQLVDPLASLLEIMSRLRRGEQAWIQICVKPPEHNTWRENGISAIKKLIGAKSGGGGGGIFGWGQDVASGTWQTLIASIIPPDSGSSSSSDNGPPNLIQYLAPHARKVVEAIGIKISKPAYETKIRVLYAAKKKVFQDDRPATIIGAMLQYNSLDLNGFKTDKLTKTSAKYFRATERKNAKKNKFIRAYKERDMDTGPKTFALNVEELASIFHFPVMTVQAPLVKKTEAKKAEPPSRLPTVEEPLEEEGQEPEVVMPPTQQEEQVTTADQAQSNTQEEQRGTPPANLPLTG